MIHSFLDKKKLNFSIFITTLTSLILTSGACGRVYSQDPHAHWSDGLGTHNFGVTCFANATHKLLWSYFRDQAASPSPATTELGRQFNALVAGFNLGLDNARHQRPSAHKGFKDQLSAFFDEFKNNEARAGSLDPITFSVQDGAETYLTRLSDYSLLFPQSLGVQKREQAIFTSDHHRLITAYAYNGELALSLNINNAGVSTVQQAIDQDLRETNDGSQLTHPLTHVREAISKQTHYALDPALSSSPQILILKLNRIIHQSGTTVKLTKDVTPNLNITVPFERVQNNPAGVPQFIPHENAQYTLKSVVVHHGSAHGGHYFTYIRNSDREWELHNDMRVELIQDRSHIDRIENEIKSTGYLFLYTLTAPTP